MKTKEELNAIKSEVESLNKKLAELSREELAQVTGGAGSLAMCWCPDCGGLLKQLTEFVDPYPVYMCTVCQKIFDERPHPVT